MKRNIYIQNMPLEQASELYMQRLEQLNFFNMETEQVDVLDAAGRITAEPVVARRSCPHYIASAMDGIAVKACSTFGASETSPVDIESNEYLEVDTGDYIPPEFDSVVMIEDVDPIPGGVRLIKPAVPWQHIRSIGEDLVAQDIIVPSCTPIGPYETASFITAAVDKVSVIKKPVIYIIPTGTELVDRGNDDMPPGDIVESNSRMLAGLCREWGAVSVRHKIIIDDRQLIKDAILEIEDTADIIIICSGSSAGREDYTSSIVEELGELVVHGLATRPGKPAILGIIKNKPVIGVPGYPVSANLIFTLFARPIIYRKQNMPLPKLPELECTIARKLASSMGVDEFVNVNVGRINNRFIAYPLNRGAGITSSLVKTDGIIHIERGNEGLQAGSPCKVRLRHSRQLIENTIIAIGSHDMSLDILADIMQKTYGIRLVSTNVGSMGGIMALRRQETHISGIHLLDYETGGYNMSYIEKYLAGQPLLLLNLVKRDQGLMVKKGNPLNISSLHDLSRKEVRFINRQKGAGTRILLDYLLAREDIDANAINGYNREEYTHLAVAASVKNDACDVGMGIYASAKIMDLDFLPVTKEQYDLCILPHSMDNKQQDCLLRAISSDDFRRRVEEFGGYDARTSGNIVFSR
ncbi:MAG TPA: molybdopterin biosynthesis protein [Syntrophomonadaceae bacterium]|nr:molybdopterin biosynthesis protein [Syntrophomonadaceae bacterium]